MNRNIKTSSMTEAAMISGILVILAYLSTFLFYGLTFIYPFPAIILAKRRGLKYSTMSLFASGLIITMLLGFQTGIYFLVLFTPLAIALSYGICKDKEANKTIMLGSAAFMISFVIMILLTQLVLGINFIQDMVQVTNESINIYKDIFNKTLVESNSADIGEINNYLDNMGKALIDMIKTQYPAIIIMSSVIVSAINYFVVSKLGHRFNVKIRKHEGLSNFSFPSTFIIAMSGLLLISFLLKFFNFNVNLIQINILKVLLMAMLLQGFAVVKFFLIKFKVVKLARVLILFLIIFSPGMGELLSFLGAIDLIVDFRKIRHKIV